MCTDLAQISCNQPDVPGIPSEVLLLTENETEKDRWIATLEELHKAAKQNPNQMVRFCFPLPAMKKTCSHLHCQRYSTGMVHVLIHYLIAFRLTIVTFRPTPTKLCYDDSTAHVTQLPNGLNHACTNMGRSITGELLI